MESLHVLVVDDDPDDVDFLTGAISKQLPGAEFTVCSTGQEALAFLQNAIAENQRPDLAFLDLHMPGVGGYQVLRELRAWDEWRDFPVMVISTSLLEAEVKRCHDAGCTEYFTKPVSLEGYDDIVAAAVGHVEVRK